MSLVPRPPDRRQRCPRPIFASWTCASSKGLGSGSGGAGHSSCQEEMEANLGAACALASYPGSGGLVLAPTGRPSDWQVTSDCGVTDEEGGKGGDGKEVSWAES